MTFEQFLANAAFRIVWEIVSPQLPGIMHVAGFVFGACFVWGLVAKFTEMIGHSVVNEGRKKEKNG